MDVERTLFIVKPDAVERHLVGRILAVVEENGFKIVEARFGPITREEAQTFYGEHQGKPFFGDLIQYMTSGPVMLVCLEREDAIAKLTELVGATDPAQAAPGTLRKQFGVSKQLNSVHRSDSRASSEREVKLFFGVGALAR